MTKREAIDLFGSVGKLARALGIRSQAVSQWPEGEIYEPRRSQVELVALKMGLISWSAVKEKSNNGRRTIPQRKQAC